MKASRQLRASLLLIAALGAGAATASAAGAPVVYSDTLKAATAFVKLPAETLDLLTTSMRMDMLDYYEHTDSIADVVNAMEGFSHLIAPVTDDWVQVQVTPVTTLTVKILPTPKGKFAMTIYTIGDSLQAADSEVRFYDARMQRLDASKYIKFLSTKDFFNFKGVDKKLKNELMDMVPFPTVEYYIDPNSDKLRARLTVGEFLGKEAMEKIDPYLRREREYSWTGSKWKLLD